MIIKSFVFSFFYLIVFLKVAQANQNFLPIPLINRDDKLLNITTQNFEITNTAANLTAMFVSEIKWERSKQNLLLPFIKIRLKTANNQKSHLHYRYKETTYLPQIKGEDEFTDLDYSVFDPTKIEVFHEGAKIGEVAVKSLSKGLKNKTVLIDYSCSGYNLQVSGFDGEFLSVGCEIVRENRRGEVIPTLNVNWISSEYKTLDLHPGPYVVSFSEGREARVTVKNEQQDKK